MANVPGYLKVKNFERFQHYKDRNPPWIKLYNDILDDYEFARLQDATKWLAVGLWLLASRYENRIPADPEWIGRRLNTTEPVDLDPLLSAGFITLYQDASTPPASRKQVDDLETEGETEGEKDVTGDKSPEAAPRGEVARLNGRGAPDPTSKQPIDRKAVAATLAPIIREHLWLGDEPPRVSGSETWDMGRDLSIAFGFLDRGEVRLDELAGAITVARRTLGLSRDRPLTMRIFQVAGRRDRLHECIAAWRKTEQASGRIGVILGDLMGGVHVAAS